MLYKVLIADDEELIREGLKQFINWSKIGYEVVADVSDGKNAIEYISNNKIDLVLTDIKMTHISGIDLTKFIHEHYPHIKVIILSAYSEFNYAVEGMKYNAENYILKTASSEEIENALINVKTKIDSYYKEKNRIESRHKTQSELIPYIKEQLLVNLLTGAIGEKNLLLNFLSLIGFDVDFLSAHATLCRIEISNFDDSDTGYWKYGKEGLYNTIRNFFDKQYIKNEKAYLYSFRKKISLLILHKGDIKLQTLQNNFTELFKLKINIIPENTFKSLEQMLDIKQFNLPSNSIKEGISHDNTEKLTQQFENLISLLNSEDFDGANNLFFALIEQFRNNNINNLKEYISEFLKDIQNKLTHKYFIDNFLKDMRASNSINEIKEIWVKNINKINYNDKRIDNYIIKDALNFINENIYNDITLEDVAQNVYLSPTYFSKLFKKKLKMNFKDYIINLKMEKAIQLLNQPQYKIYEISEILGYKSVRFFTQTFKRHTGVTPSEFRQ